MEQDGGDFVVERDVPVPMRDGVRLAADLYRPATGGRPADGPFPTVLVRTTYDKRRAQEVHDAGRFAGRGYAVVLQDVRGRYGSEGDYYHGIWEVDDGHDTVEWIAAQPWSNGRVGMTGISYLAAVQCAAAVSGTRHLVALFHVKAPADYYQHGFRQGGAFLPYTLPITLMFATDSKEARADPVLMRSLTDAFENAGEWLGRMPLKAGQSPLARVPGCEKWLFDMLRQTDYDGFWRRVPLWQPLEYLDRYADVPGYYVGGWFDLYREEQFYTALAGRKKGPIKLLIGPWTHLSFDDWFGEVDFGPDAVLDPAAYFALQLRWFDQTLKDEGRTAASEPPVKLFVMGGGDGRKTPEGKLRHGGRWRFEEGWPLARAEATAYYLQPGGGLGTEPPPADAAPSRYLYDPRDPVPTIGGASYFLRPRDPETGRWRLFAPYGPCDQRERPGCFGCRTSLPLSARHDVLVFETPPLEEDVEVTGPLAVHLWVASSAVDTDFTAKLIDLYPPSEDYPDGFALNLSDGLIRTRYRDGFERAELMKPGRIYRLTIDLFPTSNLFARGHRVRLDVSSSNYPAYDPNPNTGEPFMTGRRCVVAENVVYHDADHPSHVVLPLVPTTPGDRP